MKNISDVLTCFIYCEMNVHCYIEQLFNLPLIVLSQKIKQTNYYKKITVKKKRTEASY